MEAALERIEECQVEHKACPRQQSTRLPTRVIDVGVSGCCDNPKLHVSKANEQGIYVALSYCWGGVQQAMTTLSSIEENVQGIRWESLSQSIKDAITITRSLRIRYLWVDALCIVQDSVSDKMLEMEGMGSIYKNAVLTIAAAFCRTSQDGFLHEPLPSPAEGLSIPFLLPDSSIQAVAAFPYLITEGDEWPLEQRAWAFQEQFLSTRLLIFCGGAIRWKWKCQSGKREPLLVCHLEHSSDRGENEPAHLPSTLRGTQFLPGDNSAKPLEVLQEERELWNLIVQDFTKRSITFEDDRVPALCSLEA